MFSREIRQCHLPPRRAPSVSIVGVVIIVVTSVDDVAAAAVAVACHHPVVFAKRILRFPLLGNDVFPLQEAGFHFKRLSVQYLP